MAPRKYGSEGSEFRQMSARRSRGASSGDSGFQRSSAKYARTGGQQGGSSSGSRAARRRKEAASRIATSGEIQRLGYRTTRRAAAAGSGSGSVPDRRPPPGSKCCCWSSVCPTVSPGNWVSDPRPVCLSGTHTQPGPPPARLGQSHDDVCLKVRTRPAVPGHATRGLANRSCL